MRQEGGMEGSYLPFLLRQRRRLIPHRKRGTEEKAQLGWGGPDFNQCGRPVGLFWHQFGGRGGREGRPLARSLKEEEDEESI